MERKSDELRVRLDQHQLLLLDRLRREGSFGDTVEQILLQVFRAYVRDHDVSRGSARG